MSNKPKNQTAAPANRGAGEVTNAAPAVAANADAPATEQAPQDTVDGAAAGGGCNGAGDEGSTEAAEVDAAPAVAAGTEGVEQKPFDPTKGISLGAAGIDSGGETA